MINYTRLGHSVDYYSKLGYTRVEVPWLVTEEVSNITKPEGVKNFTVTEKRGKVLVASAEQSFLYQYLKGFLPLGKFQAITPCFRDDSFDLTHAKYFIKNELIDTTLEYDVRTSDDVGGRVSHAHIATQWKALLTMIDNAKAFFETQLTYEFSKQLKVVQIGSHQFDIMCGDIELGSYGIRECSFLSWIYGTGCAEPRMSLIGAKR